MQRVGGMCVQFLTDLATKAKHFPAAVHHELYNT